MTARSAEYTINKTVFRVTYNDITCLPTDVVVSSDDNYLTMRGGVSAALLSAGGEELRIEARKQLPLKLGDVAVTSACQMKARYIFHAVTIDFDTNTRAGDDEIAKLTLKCLQLADTLGARIIAFPALGTGTAKFPFHRAAELRFIRLKRSSFHAGRGFSV